MYTKCILFNRDHDAQGRVSHLRRFAASRIRYGSHTPFPATVSPSTPNRLSGMDRLPIRLPGGGTISHHSLPCATMTVVSL